MKNLIPKSLSKQKGVIYRNIKVLDVLLFLIISSLIFGISAGIYVLSWSYRIIIFVCLDLLSLIFFVFVPSYQERLYKVCFYNLKYRFSPKKYFKDDYKNDISLLNPYEKISKDFIKTKKIKDFGSQHLAILQIRGIDITNFSIQNASIKMDEFHSILMSLNANFVIAKINSKAHFNKQIKHLNKELDINKSDYYELVKSEKTYKSCKKNLESYIENFKNIASVLKESELENNIYLIIYHKNEDKLREEINDLKSDFDNLLFETRILDKYDSLNFVKNIYNPFEKDFDEESINKAHDNLDSLLYFEKAEFLKEGIKINDKNFIGLSAISDYPINIDNYWLSYILLFSSSQVVVKFKKLSYANSVTLLNKAIVNSLSNQYNTKKEIEKRINENVSSSFQELANEITKNNQVIKQVNILFLSAHENYDSLIKAKKTLTKELKSKNIVLDNLKYRQFEALSSFLPKPFDPLAKNFLREIPSKTIANGYPFLNSSLKDTNGILLGNNWLREPIIFDQFLLDNKRKNHNIMILGTSGSGKTFLAKKLLSWSASINKDIFVIDIEKEYTNLAYAFGGEALSLGTTQGGKINPLQIFSLDESGAKNQILAHILYLEQFFKIIFPDFQSNQLRYLLLIIKDYYFQNEFDLKNIEKLSEADFPIFSDIYKFAIKHNKKYLKIYGSLDVELVNSIIKNELVDNGVFSSFFNNYSSIKRKSNFSVFDFSALFDKSNKKLIHSQLYLALNYIQKEVKLSKKQSIVLIDEAHVLIDKDNPIGLDFVYQISKKIRKFNGALIFISQSPDDFVSSEEVTKKTKAILNNTQYSFFFNLSPNNILDIEKMYKAYGDGFAEDEKLFIAKAKKGQALFLVSGFDRHKITINYSKQELKMLNTKVKKGDIYG